MSKLDNSKKRIIHTGLYSNVAKEIISSVIGQLGDGWGESNLANEKWWRFADCVPSSDGEVLIEVSTEPWEYDEFRSYRHKYTYNGFHSMSDVEVMQKFASWIKKTAKMEMKDENAGNQWNRGSEMELDYLSYHENVTAADAYFVYEKLLGRDNSNKYAEHVVSRVIGAKRSAAETAAAKRLNEKIANLVAERNEAIKELRAKKDEKLKVIEAEYSKEYCDLVNRFKKLEDELKA